MSQDGRDPILAQDICELEKISSPPEAAVSAPVAITEACVVYYRVRPEHWSWWRLAGMSLSRRRPRPWRFCGAVTGWRDCRLSIKVTMRLVSKLVLIDFIGRSPGKWLILDSRLSAKLTTWLLTPVGVQASI